MAHADWFGLGFGVLMGAVACSTSDAAGGGPATTDGGCHGGGCSAAQGGSGGSGVGGTANQGGATNPGAGGNPATTCTLLDLAPGASSPDGILALHVPPANSFGGVYRGGIAVSNGYVYFGVGRVITRVPIAGGPPEPIQIAQSSNAQFFVIGSNVVWFDQDSTTMKNGIFSVPVTATPDAGAPKVVAAAIDEPEYVVSDATAVYFSNRAKQIWYRAPLDGSGVTQVVANAEPLGAVVSNGTLYWIDFNTSQVMSVPTAGGQATSLVGAFFGGPMAAEGTTLFWDDTSQETVNRWSPGERNPTVLAHFGPFEGAGTIAVQNGDVYYTHEGFGCGGISRIPADGSKITTVANGFDAAGALAVDTDNVYVVADNGVFRFHR